MWIDGSFLNIKNDRPQDVDFVVFIDYKIYDAYYDLFEKRFRKLGAKAYYGKNIDAYISPIYPSNHKNAFYTEDYQKYWLNFFSKTKADRHNKHYSKGFVKIQFGENEIR